MFPLSAPPYILYIERIIYFVIMSTSLQVLKQSKTNNQIAYYILEKGEAKWIKLCEANRRQMRAIIDFQAEGHDEMYLPSCTEDDWAEESSQYCLRERQWQFITQQEFYGLASANRSRGAKQERNATKEEAAKGSLSEQGHIRVSRPKLEKRVKRQSQSRPEYLKMQQETFIMVQVEKHCS